AAVSGSPAEAQRRAVPASSAGVFRGRCFAAPPECGARRPSAALQMRNKQRLLGVLVELTEQFTGAAVSAQRGAAKTAAGQLAESLFRERHRLRIGHIEFVTGVAEAVHHD